MRYTIKNAAEKTGLSIDTLRYYDKLEIVSPKRKENGYRYYTEEDITKLQYAVVMKYATFSLDDIKRMVEWFDADSDDLECNYFFKDMLSKNLKKLEERIDTYQQIVILMQNVLPMIESAEVYMENEGLIENVIEMIFQRVIKGEKLERV